MNAFGYAFVAIHVLLLLFLPRRWASFPLLMGACYMTFGQVIEVGPFHFTVIRILVGVGAIRVILRREWPAGKFCSIDWLIIAWAVWALCSSAFHLMPNDTLVNHLGLVYNALGIYMLIRCFCQNRGDVEQFIKMAAILLVPVALEMVSEQLTKHNLFAVFGGVPEVPELRNERFRSQGPFAHAILAGTVGSVCMPLMIGIWHKHRRMAMTGIIACLLMILASASSGPLMSLMFGILALILWRWRHRTPQVRIAAVLGYILLDLVMKPPAYYLLARIDLTGSSTGWHRARLIESSMEHLKEWWWAGTDFTRHWMPTGVPWNENHTDITNYYLEMGVMGGLPLMLLFIAVLTVAFMSVGQTVRRTTRQPHYSFMVWTLGASLFSHAATFVSVAYSDQSFIFLYSTLAAIGSASAVVSSAKNPRLSNTYSSPTKRYRRKTVPGSVVKPDVPIIEHKISCC